MKIQKQLYLGHLLTDLHQFGVRLDIGHAMVTTAQNPIFLKSKMADGRHLENTKTAISQPFIDRFARKKGVQIDIGHARVTMAQNRTFPKIQDGGRPPS